MAGGRRDAGPRPEALHYDDGEDPALGQEEEGFVAGVGAGGSEGAHEEEGAVHDPESWRELRRDAYR